MLYAILIRDRTDIVERKIDERRERRSSTDECNRHNNSIRTIISSVLVIFMNAGVELSLLTS